MWSLLVTCGAWLKFLAVEEVSLVISGDKVQHLSHFISVLILIMLPNPDLHNIMNNAIA